MYAQGSFERIRANRASILNVFVIELSLLLLVNSLVNGLDINGKYLGTLGFDSAEDIVIDSASNSAYITGYTDGSLSNYTNYGSDDIVVMKLDLTTLTPIWTLQYGSTVADQGLGIAYESANGRLYVSGYTQGVLPGLSPDPIVVCGFLLRMDSSNGSIVWSTRIGYNNTQAFKVAVDSSNGIIYVAGITNENLVQNNLGYDSFITKIDPNGTRIWTAQISSLGDDFLTRIVVDPNSDAVYAAGKTNAGKFLNTYINSGGQLSHQDDLIAIKLRKSNGAFLWANGTGSPGGDDGAVGLALSPSGSVLVATGFAGGTILGYYPFYGDLDSVTVAFNTATGEWIWIGMDGTAQYDAGQAVTMDSSNIYIVGYTNGSMYGEPNIGGRDGFLITYSYLGYRNYTYQFGSNSSDDIGAVAGNLGSRLLVCGSGAGDLYGSAPVGESDMAIFTFAYPSPSPSVSPSPTPSPTTGLSPSSTPSSTPNPTSSPTSSPTPDSQSNNSSGSRNSTALIAGVVGAVGGAILVAVLAGLAFWRLKKQQKSQEDNIPASVEMHPAPENGSIVFNTVTYERRNTLIPEQHRKYVIKYSEIVLGDQLGAGAFGVVFKGTWRAQQVAVKRVKEDLIGPDTGTEFKDFLMEALVMMRLKPHKNITTLYAVCLSPLCIVTEFVENGSLEKYLLRKEFTLKELINFLRDIAAGMTHLAAEGVVHKDLAARNVLVTASGSAKIADFGLARNIQEKHYSYSAIGPLRWMSPENLLKKEFSEKSDVWSFAATAVEIFTKTIPYPGMEVIVVTREVMNGTLKPEIPSQVQTKDGVSQVPVKLSGLVTQCASFETAARPTFAEIVETLNIILGVEGSNSTTNTYVDTSTINSNQNSTDNEYNTGNRPPSVKQPEQENYQTTNRSNTYTHM